VVSDFSGMFDDFPELMRDITVMQDGTPGGFDADGRQGVSTGDQTPVRGALQPIPLRIRSQRQQAGAVGSVPAYFAYLPITAPVQGMGYHLVIGDLSYYPWEDAQDVGGVGEFYRVTLGSPGQRGA
jgi:hypothetical protein